MNRYEDAFRLYEKAIEIDPSYAYTYFSIARALLQAGRFDEGLLQLAQAITAGQGQNLTSEVALYVNEINQPVTGHCATENGADRGGTR